jgi:hypothetical protein
VSPPAGPDAVGDDQDGEHDEQQDGERLHRSPGRRGAHAAGPTSRLQEQHGEDLLGVLGWWASGPGCPELAGFAAGGDDHLAKPFHVSELQARLRAMIRRGRAPPPPPRRIRPDPARHTIAAGGGERPLTPTEFRLLAALMGAAGTVVRRRVRVQPSRARRPTGQDA